MMAVTTHPHGQRPLFTEDHEAFRDSVRRFVAADVAPGLDEWRTAGETPRAIFTAAGNAGFLGITAAEEFGGGGIDDRGFLAVLIEETVDSGATGLAVLWGLHSGVVVPTVEAHASSEVRDRWLPGLVAGELIGVPVPLGDLKVDAHGLTGELRNVPFGSIADVLIGLLPRAGAVLIALDQPGVQVKRVEGNLATPDAGVADITLDGVRTEPLADDATARGDLNVWFSVIAASAARYALDLAIDYVRERKVFGKPLVEFENTRMRLAQLSAEVAVTTSFVDTCVSAGAAVSSASAAVACVTAGDLHDRCVDQSLQLHGGYGYMREYPVSAAFADARFLRLLTQQYTNVARELAEELGL